MLRIVILFVLPICSSGFGLGIGRTQSTGVKGRLMCNDKSASDVKVKLYDDDRGLDSDDLLAEGRTNRDGYFEIKGYTQELSTIDPKLNIYHKCDKLIPICYRKITIYISDKYVSKGKIPTQIYDAGIIQLAGKFKGETTDCFNRA